MTPIDELAFIGYPPLPSFRPEEDLPVRISVTFTWDYPTAVQMAKSWAAVYSDVRVGGPACGDWGGEFSPGLFLRDGAVITSRGCPRKCKHCFVPGREGKIRELEILDGWDVLDNNLLACSPEHVERVFEMLRRQSERIRLTGGLDACLFNERHVELLKSIHIQTVFFAYDAAGIEPHLCRVVEMLGWIPEKRRRCYVLIGYPGDSLSDADRRLRWVYNIGFLPYPMVYRDDSAMSQAEAIDRKWVELKGWWMLVKNYRHKDFDENKAISAIKKV